jgi:hypothetical protein
MKRGLLKPIFSCDSNKHITINAFAFELDYKNKRIHYGAS